MKKNITEKLTVKKIHGIPYIRVIRGIGIINEFPAHNHKQLCIGIILTGTRAMTFGGDTTTYKKNDMFIINPEQVHTCTTPGNTPHSYIVITLDTAAVNITENIFFRNIIARSDGICAGFTRLISVIESGVPLLEKESLIHSFIEIILPLYSSGSIPGKVTLAQRSAVNRARGFLECNLTDKISMCELSEATGLSRFHFNRVFRKVTGLSPYAYHLHVRIEHAKHMLTTGKPIVEAALDSGFSDQGHFSRYFRKIVGVTPGVFLKYNS